MYVYVCTLPYWCMYAYVYFLIELRMYAYVCFCIDVCMYVYASCADAHGAVPTGTVSSVGRGNALPRRELHCSSWPCSEKLLVSACGGSVLVHTYIHTYVSVCRYVCVCVCVFVCYIRMCELVCVECCRNPFSSCVLHLFHSIQSYITCVSYTYVCIKHITFCCLLILPHPLPLPW